MLARLIGTVFILTMASASALAQTTYYPQAGGSVGGTGLLAYDSPYIGVNTGDCTVGEITITATGTPTSGETPGFDYVIATVGTASIRYTVQAGDTNNSIAAGLATAMRNDTLVRTWFDVSCPDGKPFSGTGHNPTGQSVIIPVNNVLYYDQPWPLLGLTHANAVSSAHTTITTGANRGNGSNLGANPTVLYNRYVAGRQGINGDFLHQMLVYGQNDSTGSARYGALQWSVKNVATGGEQGQAQFEFGNGANCGLVLSGTNSFATLNAPGGCQLAIPGGYGSGGGTHYLCWNSATGGLSINGACGTSDPRFKKDWKYDLPGLAVLDRLNPGTFDWIDDWSDKHDGRQIGLDASEVKAALPWVATQAGDGTALGIDYAKLTVAEIVWIKELVARNADLDRRIQRLESAIRP